MPYSLVLIKQTNNKYLSLQKPTMITFFSFCLHIATTNLPASWFEREGDTFCFEASSWNTDEWVI